MAHKDSELQAEATLVAHDLTNLLGVILNYTQFALDTLPTDHSARDDLESVQRAAREAAELTRRLARAARV